MYYSKIIFNSIYEYYTSPPKYLRLSRHAFASLLIGVWLWSCPNDTHCFLHVWYITPTDLRRHCAFHLLLHPSSSQQSMCSLLHSIDACIRRTWINCCRFLPLFLFTVFCACAYAHVRICAYAHVGQRCLSPPASPPPLATVAGGGGHIQWWSVYLFSIR